jgi:alpha-glucosidase
MRRKSPSFQSLGEIKTAVESPKGNVLAFERGYAFVRTYIPEALNLVITQDPEPDTLSWSLKPRLNPIPDALEREGEMIRLRSGEAFLQWEKDQFSFWWKDTCLWKTEAGLPPGTLGADWILSVQRDENQDFFGFGEKTGGLNRKGNSYLNWNTDAFAYHDGRDPIYASLPFYLSRKEGIWFGVLLDNPARSRFNFGASNDRMMQIRLEAGDLNLHFIAGPSPEEVLKRYHQLTGTTSLPPRWALGLQQCRYSYYPEHELLAVADNYRKRNIPCDVLYLDIHYMDRYRVFTVDKCCFPDLKASTQRLEKEGFKLVVIQDPGITEAEDYPIAKSLIEKGKAVKYPDGKPWRAGVWPGLCIFPDFTDAQTRNWWAQTSADWLQETGVRGLWNDMNEPATWGQDPPDFLEFAMEGRGGSHVEAHNVYGQAMTMATQEGIRRAYPGERPFVLTRAAFAGIQRYAAVWSGDNVASEEHFFLGIRLMLSMAMSGVPFNGPDVGGFVGDAGKNLFVRWVSVASFFPFFRLHSMIDSRDNEPWSYGELAESIATNFIRLRYKLLSNLYSAFYRHSQTGETLVSPGFWHVENQTFETRFQHQFLWADALWMAPCSPEQQAVEVQLPEGNWMHLFTGNWYAGGMHWMACPTDQFPVLAKPGAILLSKDPGRFADDPEAVGFDLHLFEGQGTSEQTFYEDDGLSENPADQDRVVFSIQMDWPNMKLKGIRKEGSKPLTFRKVYVWTKDQNQSHLHISGTATNLQSDTYGWLEALPNFDPFENKSNFYQLPCLSAGLNDFSC